MIQNLFYCWEELDKLWPSAGIMSEGMSMINPTMWVNSVRSSGYRDAAMALGELIDNSLQAGASDVEVLVKENRAEVVRSRQKVKQLWASESVPKWLK